MISEIPFSHKDEIVKGLGLGQTLIYIWQKSATRRLVPNGQKTTKTFFIPVKMNCGVFLPSIDPPLQDHKMLYGENSLIYDELFSY